MRVELQIDLGRIHEGELAGISERFCGRFGVKIHDSDVEAILENGVEALRSPGGFNYKFEDGSVLSVSHEFDKLVIESPDHPHVSDAVEMFRRDVVRYLSYGSLEVSEISIRSDF